jgi:hypothetical protein
LTNFDEILRAAQREKRTAVANGQDDKVDQQKDLFITGEGA